MERYRLRDCVQGEVSEVRTFRSFPASVVSMTDIDGEFRRSLVFGDIGEEFIGRNVTIANYVSPENDFLQCFYTSDSSNHMALEDGVAFQLISEAGDRGYI